MGVEVVCQSRGQFSRVQYLEFRDGEGVGRKGRGRLVTVSSPPPWAERGETPDDTHGQGVFVKRRPNNKWKA